MVIHRLKGILGVVAAGSFLLSSTAAVASAPASVQQVDPWAVLTAMSNGAPAAAMCGAAAAMAQAPGGCVLPVVDAPPPPVQTVEAVPPPPVPVAAGGGISPLLIGLLALAAGVGIFLAVNNNGNHANSPA
jgi:hypothetical protein